MYHWFKSYINFAERVDFALMVDFLPEGSAPVVGAGHLFKNRYYYIII